MANFKNITESGIIKSTNGELTGIIVNSHTSGTLKLTDGDENGVAATGTLTSTGACAPADYAAQTLTSDGTAFDGGAQSQGTITVSGTPVAEETLTVGDQVYTFVEARSGAGEITIDADNAVQVTNIVAAITADQTDVTAADGAGDTVVCTVVEFGTAGDAVVLDESATGIAVDGGGTFGTTTAGADPETITINTTVYRLMAVTEKAYDVKIGANAAATLDNLKLAINASGVGDGTDYHAGTLAHPEVIATTNTDTTQVIRAKVIGTAPNAYVTEETCAHAAFGAGTLAGGVATTAATITIDGKVYTATKTLPDTLGYTPIDGYVLWVTNEATFLDNLKLAINENGTAGTEYSAATVEHPTVKATTNAADAQTVEAKSTGTGGNSIATTDTLGNYAWGAATLTGGAGDEISTIIMDTYTFPAGSSVINFGSPIYFDRGLYAVIGGTAANVTLICK